MGEEVKVEQCDRDAAADCGGTLGWAQWAIDMTRSGKNDHWPSVQAFARHRLTERERCAVIAEKQFDAREWHPELRRAGANIAGEIRTNIRSGKEPSA